MRKLVVASMLVLAVMASPACKDPDPNKFETHIERIKDGSKRAQGFAGLDTLVKTVASAQDNDDLLQEFTEKVVPVFEEIWDEAKEQQPKMLQMCLDIGHPGAAPVWNKAVMLDGSAEARDATILALQGIKKSKASDSAETVITALEKLVADPKNDGGDKPGEVRALMVDTLGELGDPKAVPVLISVLEQTQDKQPVGVHRKAATALGMIGDPSAVDALITATYRVPDALTTTNIAEKAKIALASIGEPAVPRVLAMLKAEHAEVQKLAAQHGITQDRIQIAAAGILGAIGSENAVTDLLTYLPTEECKAPAEDEKKKEPKEGEQEDELPVIDTANLRAVIGNSLGLIGSDKAVEALCTCSTWSKNPADMFAIAEALGRIGGPAATTCLENVIKTGVYDQGSVENSDFVHEIRWEAGRFGVLAAGADGVGAIKAALEEAKKDPNVAKNVGGWDPGIETIEKCTKDLDCYLGVVKDSNADWFAREVAAVNAARMAPNDVKVAKELAKAYKVRSPDGRVTMAWLAGHIMQGNPCDECADTIERIIEDEKMSRPPKEYQLSVLMARYTMGKLRPKATGGAAKKGGG